MSESSESTTESRNAIVVARYGENISWTNEFPRHKVIIYNKGAKLEGSYNEVQLINVGREGHTYYKHICDNYNDLDDYTYFLQGHPFDHSPRIIENIKGGIDTTKDFAILSEAILDTNLLGCRYHAGLPFSDVFSKLFDKEAYNFTFKFGAGAQFVVSKEAILRRPKTFYMKIVEMLEHNANPIEGFVIERLHTLIFASDSCIC